MSHHSEYNRYFKAASARVGLPIELFKSICEIESGWDHNFKSGEKIGLAGLIPELATAACQLIYGPHATPTERDLMHAEENIMCLAAVLRVLYNHRSNENANMEGIVLAYGKQMKSSLQGYREAWWKAYQKFCDLPGEPESTLPNEVEGFYQRKPNRTIYL